MVYYMCGPPPISSETRVLPLDYVLNSGLNYVRNPILDFFSLFNFGLEMALNISDITQDLLGATASRENPDDPNGLLAWPRGLRLETGGLIL